MGEAGAEREPPRGELFDRLAVTILAPADIVDHLSPVLDHVPRAFRRRAAVGRRFGGYLLAGERDQKFYDWLDPLEFERPRARDGAEQFLFGGQPVAAKRGVDLCPSWGRKSAGLLPQMAARLV